MTRKNERIVAQALARAVEVAGGTQTALARKLGCSRQNVSLMIAHRRVTVERAKQIERLLGIPREELLPHVYE